MGQLADTIINALKTQGLTEERGRKRPITVENSSAVLLSMAWTTRSGLGVPGHPKKLSSMMTVVKGIPFGLHRWFRRKLRRYVYLLYSLYKACLIHDLGRWVQMLKNDDI